MPRFIALALLALLSAVPALAQEDSPGVSRGSAGVIGTGPVHMGTNLIDGSNLQFTGGTLTGLTHAGGTLSGTFTGSPILSLGGAVTFSAAGTALTVTNNTSLGGTLTTGAGGTNGFLMSSSTLSVTGTGNPLTTFQGLGTGAIRFRVGATPFTALTITDGGASEVNSLNLIPGTTGNGVSLFAVGDAAAVLNLKAGTSGTAGSVHSFAPMRIDASLYQPTNIVLSGAPPAAASTSGIFQTINLSGNDGATPANSGVNFYSLTDTANINGLGAQVYYLARYNAGADGNRLMMETVYQKNAQSLSGNALFLLDRKTMQAVSGEGGTGDTITASQVGNLLTVTSAPLANLQVGTIISGDAMPSITPFETIVGLGTGVGGTGTYTMSKIVDFGSITATAGNYKGSFENQNQVLQCIAAWISGCQMVELDLSATHPVQLKQGFTISYALGDSAHGVWVDCAFCIVANQNAGGGGRVMFSVGSGTANWPIDPLALDTAILRAQRNTTRSATANFAQQYKATFGVDFTILNCGTACWASPGFSIDGNGSVAAGPLRVTYSSAGATIAAPGLHVASASITSGGTGYKVDEQLLEPLSGSLWQVTGVGAFTTVTSMTLLRSGYPTSCPGAATPFTDLANGTGLKATLTCDTSNGITVGASGNNLGFYGATAIAKATPSGACAGNTGCQALRDALGNLGLINTGSISN
jgi:hypothetical protein